MWYVVQTKSGDEEKIVYALNSLLDEESNEQCFTPLFEDVRRTGNETKIIYKKLFPEYLFIETEKPDLVSEALRSVPNFSRVLGSRDNEGNRIFIPVDDKDKEFIQSLLIGGVMRVSYIRLSKNNKILEVKGPLAKYKNHITKMEIRHRMAIVDMDVFGKQRKIKFGLWTDEDPTLPWIEEIKAGGADAAADDSWDIDPTIDIGIHPGDIVVDETGVYGDIEFVVNFVDTRYRRIQTTLNMGITKAKLELSVDSVRVVEG